MSESILSHLLLYECLSWDFLPYHDKIRPSNLTEQSRFLNSLALVLNGSANCTAVYVDLSNKIVFIARNEPITSNDERYFTQFFDQIKTYATLASLYSINSKEIDDATDPLDSIICEYNSKKMIQYFDRHPKVIDGLREMIKWNTDEKKSFIEELHLNKESYTNKPFMTEKIYLILKNYTEEGYVNFLLKKVGEFLNAYDQLFKNQVNPSEHQLMVAAQLAMLLYQSRLFQYILDHSIGTGDKGVYYFEKTSAHIRAVNVLLKCLHNNTERYGEIYKNILWKLVPPLMQQTHKLNITPRQAFENIFKNLPHSSNEIISKIQKTTSESFYNQYLEKLKEIDKEPVYVGNVHAEILLIDYILNNNIEEKDYLNQVEIGISKMPCLPCSFYITALNEKHGRCFYQCDVTHGKLYGKWIYRSDEDPSIINEINDKLIKKLQNLIKKILVEGGRKGDPKNSGDSDIMHTSIEGDEFEAGRYRKLDP